ncbi:hypothetical protein KOY48_02485 [Candidatus Minimicrobia naudis]|uniref:Uncharacterized protein n=1 Tax=Candidatus Minimicrobia naudis TaxID=2841263 RepID=A0A8F1SBH6_9BACT|nr:hypothetical protein KOY48_02485 [Candidatus Minimicrobia naudis]
MKHLQFLKNWVMFDNSHRWYCYIPDTTFHLFGGDGGWFLILVMTDYADPLDQSRELKNISGEYAFEFTKLIKPYSNDEYIEIKENDEILEDPTVSDPH